MKRDISSLEYSDATSGTKIGVVPSLAGSPQPPRSHDGSPFSNPPKYIEQRFGIGLGQEFSTSGSEALDTTNYPVTNLTWNQLEQQAEADRAQARISEGNSNESDSDAEASENENAEDEAAEEGDVERPEAIDEEQGLPVRRSQRRSRRGRKRSLPAAPRPKPAEQPIVVRNLFPIVISIEPQLNGDVLLQKPVVEAQITHACLVSSPLSMESPVTDANQASSSSGDMKYDCKVLRQKLLVNSAVYNVYDIFGVEQVTGDDSMQSTCVICMSEPRTTLVIPCRHMCLCEDCAETLKVQSVKCPICRGPVRSLMKIEVSMEDNDDDGSEKGANDKSMAPKRSPKQSENGRAQHALQLEEVDSNEDEDNEDDDEDDEDDDNVNASLVRSK